MKCEKCGKIFTQKINKGTICKKCLLKQGLKFCPHCKQLLPITEFHNRDINHNKNGHCSVCKECKSKEMKEYYTYQRFCKRCGTEIGKGKHLCSKCRENVKIERQKNQHRPIYYELIAKEYDINLPRSVVIHHIDYNHENNNFENLYIFKSQSAHSSYHQSLAKWAAKFPFMNYEEAQKTYPKLISNIKNFKK